MPSANIAVAIADLIATVSNFSDSHFDAAWMHLSEAELETLTLKLIQHLSQNIDGRQLAGLLLMIREQGKSDASLS